MEIKEIIEMKDLMNECEALIEENQKKKDIVKNSLEELCNRCLKNYRTLFVPEFVSLRKLTSRLCKIVPSTIIDWNVSDSSGKNFSSIVPSSDFPEFTQFGYKEFYDELNDVKAGRVSADNLAEMFSTPDRTLRTLSFFKEAFARILKTLARCIRDRNDELEKTVERVVSILEDSSCVKENDDSSVEIKINGKTYIGTLKEA